MPSPKTDNDIVTDLITREGGLVNDVGDSGGLTFEGISIKANPDLFAHGIPTEAQVRQRYEERYIQGPGFDQITDLNVRALLVDWGVNSGPAIAISGLQGVVGTTVDGVLGPATVAATNALPPERLIRGLVAARVKMIGRLLTKNPSQVKFAAGWLNRAVEWLM